MNCEAYWIWAKEDEATYRDKIEICHFRKKFTVKENECILKVQVSADSRYRLYINGHPVSIGPCKGDRWRQYYETVDLTQYLFVGENILAAMVVHFPENELLALGFKTGPSSVMSKAAGAFYVREDSGGGNGCIDSGSDWRVTRNRAVTFVETEFAKYAGDFERVDGGLFPYGWTLPDYDDSSWEDVQVLCPALPHNQYGGLYPWQLVQRPIPALYEKNVHFKQISRTGQSGTTWEILLKGEDYLTIPPNTRTWVELDMGELTTSYFGIRISAGKGSKIRIQYAESYVKFEGGKTFPVKGVRDEAEGMEFRGESDCYIPGGGDEYYEPFFFRTFRFVRLDIETGDSPLQLSKLTVRETGYPIPIEGGWRHDDAKWQALWDVSIRTLKRCIHETYEDCPYYEQMQYTMDTQLQILFSYQISMDDRLARKAIHDFHSSLNPEGFLLCNYPSKYPQVIPGFSVFWIRMLHDHYYHFGDLDLIRRYIPTVEAVLGYFERKMDSGSKMVGNLGYWQFVDWVGEWDGGVPPTGDGNVITVYNMMVVHVFHLSAELYRAIGRKDTDREWRRRAGELSDAIIRNTWCPERKMFRDAPGIDSFSEHAQVWATLSGVAVGKQAVQLMRRTMKDGTLAKCSYAMSHFLFRALSRTGLYDLTEALWKPWLDLLDMNVTTWPEDPVNARSDCHAWGALPLYEFTAEILGVRPGKAGYGEIRIEPKLLTLGRANGKVATKWGVVSVFWEVCNGLFKIHVELPEPVRTVIHLPNGEWFESFGELVLEAVCDMNA